MNCNTDGNGYGLLNASIGTLTYDEAILMGMQAGRSMATNSLMFTIPDSDYIRLMSPHRIQKANGLPVQNWVFDFSTGLGLDQNAGGTYDKNFLPVINIRNDVGSEGSGTTGDMYTLN